MRNLCPTLGEELQTARYRLYRSQILQQNMRWKALAEIYTMHSFAPVSNLKIFVNICKFLAKFARFLLILREFLTLGVIFWNLQYIDSHPSGASRTPPFPKPIKAGYAAVGQRRQPRPPYPPWFLRRHCPPMQAWTPEYLPRLKIEKESIRSQCTRNEYFPNTPSLVTAVQGIFSVYDNVLSSDLNRRIYF